MSANGKFQGRKVIIGCCIYLFFIFGFVTLYSCAYALLPETYGISLSVLSYCVTACSVSGALSALICSKFTQKVKLKGCLLTGIMAVVVFSLCMTFIPNAIGLAIAFFVLGFITGLSGYAVAIAIISNWYIKNQKTYIAFPLAAATFGCSFYTYVGGFLFERFPVRTVFLVAGLVTAGIGLITKFVFLKHTSPEEIGQKPLGYGEENEDENSSDHPVSVSTEAQIKKSIYKNPVTWLYLFSAFTDATSVSYIYVYFATFFMAYGLQYTTCTTIMSILSLASGVLAFFAGKLMEKLGSKVYLTIIYGAAIIANVIMIIYPEFQGSFLIVLTCICYVIGYQCGCVGTLLSKDYAIPEHAFNLNTKYTATCLIGSIVLMPLFGSLVQSYGFVPMYVITGMGCLLSLIAYLISYPLVEKRGRV